MIPQGCVPYFKSSCVELCETEVEGEIQVNALRHRLDEEDILAPGAAVHVCWGRYSVIAETNTAILGIDNEAINQM